MRRVCRQPSVNVVGKRIARVFTRDRECVEPYICTLYKLLVYGRWTFRTVRVVVRWLQQWHLKRSYLHKASICTFRLRSLGSWLKKRVGKMPTRAGSIISKISDVTSFSAQSYSEAKSLRGLDIDNDYVQSIQETCMTIDTKNCKILLLTVPSGFPKEHLDQIPLESGVCNNVDIVDNNNNDVAYTCDVTVEKLRVSKSLLLPSSESKYTCRKIKDSVTVRKSFKSIHSGSKMFLPVPDPPMMSEGLFERVKPYGWEGPASGNTDFQSHKKHGKKRKAEKEALESPRIKQEKSLKKKLLKKDSLMENLMGFADIDKTGQDIDEDILNSSPKKKAKKKKKHKHKSKSGDMSLSKKKKKKLKKEKKKIKMEADSD